MRKIKEILRFHHEMGLSRRRIAESLQVAHSTVGDVIRRANGVGLSWPIPDTMTWVDVERLLYPLSGQHEQAQGQAHAEVGTDPPRA